MCVHAVAVVYTLGSFIIVIDICGHRIKPSWAIIIIHTSTCQLYKWCIHLHPILVLSEFDHHPHVPQTLHVNTTYLCQKSMFSDVIWSQHGRDLDLFCKQYRADYTSMIIDNNTAPLPRLYIKEFQISRFRATSSAMIHVILQHGSTCFYLY